MALRIQFYLFFIKHTNLNPENIGLWEHRTHSRGPIIYKVNLGNIGPWEHKADLHQTDMHSFTDQVKINEISSYSPQNTKRT